MAASDLAPRFGLYVHVPFCSALCPYCDFAVVVGKPDLHEWYCDSLVAEAASLAAHATEPAGSLFVGGGTPTLVDPQLLARALDGIRASIPVSQDAECTVEANPESVTTERLRVLRDAGINRASIGAQSFDADVLRALGRTHAEHDTREAVAAAREAGIENISVDLIYGGPGETDEGWHRSLREAIALEPTHVSCYALTIEEATPFGKAVASGRMSEPEQDALAQRYERAREMLGDAGFTHYEISNWALPGYESRHNLVYWTQGDYLGLGLGAHSHARGTRWWNTRKLRDYLADPTSARDGEEELDPRARAEEWVSLRVRLIEGLDLRVASEKLGRGLEASAESLVSDGLATRDGDVLVLTSRGMLLENEVTLRLLG